jgi:hypothetical protein
MLRYKATGGGRIVCVGGHDVLDLPIDTKTAKQIARALEAAASNGWYYALDRAENFKKC